MRRNLAANSVNADFLDGYLFRLLQQIRDEKGLDESGLFDYYGARIDRRLGGMLEYEHTLGQYILDNFKGRPVVHAGMGVGMLASFLAVNGMRIAGIDTEPKRIVTANKIRSALISIWPEVEGNYEILGGFYPDIVEHTKWPSRQGVLVFTNVANAWSSAQTDAILRSLLQYGDVVLDLRCFGIKRTEEADLTELFNRLAAKARAAKRLPHIDEGYHYAHFVFGQ